MVGINAHAKQSPDSPNSAPLQRLPSAHLPIPSSDLVQEQAQQQQQLLLLQAKKSDQKEQTGNVTSHVTPAGAVLDERHATPLDEGSRPPASSGGALSGGTPSGGASSGRTLSGGAPSGGQQFFGDRLRLGSGDSATGSVMLIEENGGVSTVASQPGSSRPTRPRPQQHPTTPDDQLDPFLSLNRSPKELMIVSDNEHLPTPLIHHGGAEVLPVGRPPLAADISNANSWVPTGNEKSGGIPLNITDDTGAKVNSTSGFHQRIGGDRRPDGIVAPPPLSDDPSQNYSGSLLFQPSLLLPPQLPTISNGEHNSTMSDDEEVSDSPIDASPTKGRQQNMRRINGNRKSQSQRQRQRSLSSSTAADNSTTSSSISGGETTTQGINSATNGNQITGNRRTDAISDADNLAFPQPVSIVPHDVHALGQWPPFGHPMDNHGPELPIGNGGGLDPWHQSHSTGAHPQFSPMFPPNWPHRQPGLDVAFFPVNENETTANGTYPTGTENIFPIFHAPLGQHHPAKLPPPERFPDQFLAPGGGRMGDFPHDMHITHDDHSVGQNLPHPGPPDFIVPSFINPVDQLPASVGPSTPTSLLTGAVHFGSGIQLTDDGAASVTSPSSSSQNISVTEAGRNYVDSSTPLTTSSQSFSSTRSGSATTGTSSITLSSATTSANPSLLISIISLPIAFADVCLK